MGCHQKTARLRARHARRCRPGRPRRVGLTLIEVMAGLGLLATVLVLVFAARDHVARQQVRADRRLAAVAAADALLADWMRNPAAFPRAGAGPVPGRPDLAWSTRVVSNPPAEALGAQAVRLEVGQVDRGVADREPGGGPADGRPVVVAVEVVLPVERPPARPPPARPGRR